MSKTFAERVEVVREGHRFEFDLFYDTELAREVSYVLRGYRALELLHKAPHLEAGRGMHVFSTRFPLFKRTKEGIALYSAKLDPSPHNEGEYWLMVDERLSEAERLAVITHELGRLAGGFHEDERPTQKAAIQVMTELYGNYDVLAETTTRESLHKRGINFNVRERPKKKFKEALEYLTRSGRYFGITSEDLHDAGLTPLKTTRSKGLENRFGFIVLILAVAAAASLPLVPTGFSIRETSAEEASLLPYALIIFFVGVALFVYIESKKQKPIR